MVTVLRRCSNIAFASAAETILCNFLVFPDRAITIASFDHLNSVNFTIVKTIELTTSSC